MDIKNSPTKYAETIGLKAFDLSPVQESINILKNSGVDYEFRTTVTADFHTKDSMKELSEWIMNTPKYFLQNFVDSGQLIDSNCRGVSKAEMYELLDIVRVNIPNAQIRGI